MIHELVDRFRTQIDAYKTQSYNETQVRREFIDLMFTALGWDVANGQRRADRTTEAALGFLREVDAPFYSAHSSATGRSFEAVRKPAISAASRIKPDAGSA